MGSFSAGETKNRDQQSPEGAECLLERNGLRAQPRERQIEVNFPLKTHLVPKSALFPYGQPLGSAEPRDAQKH